MIVSCRNVVMSIPIMLAIDNISSVLNSCSSIGSNCSTKVVDVLFVDAIITKFFLSQIIL